MRQLLVPLLSLPLLACQSAALVDESLPPAGSRLVLKQELVIPAGTAHVTLQGGRVAGGNDINRYHPYCQIEVRKVSDRPQKLSPDEFLIRRAYLETNTAQTGGFQQVAGRIGFSNGSPTFLIYRTVFNLSSNRQPEVRWMVCEHWSDPAQGRNLSLNEIRIALGEIVALVTPDGGKHPI